MTKKEIVKHISDKLDVPQLITKDVVQMTLDMICEALMHEGRIELRNFGVFEVRKRKSRTARNPRTGHEVRVPAKNVVAFQPGKVMEEKIGECKNAIEPKQKSRKPAKVTSSSSDSQSSTSPPDASDPPLKPR